jgi:hypothetical protein
VTRIRSGSPTHDDCLEARITRNREAIHRSLSVGWLAVPRANELMDWPEIADEPWSGLLVGNGASMAVWPQFSYKSLFDEARGSGIDRRLTGEDLALFEALDATRNFEHVLNALSTAMTVNEALQFDSEHLDERYVSIQQALFDAVRAVHIPWSAISAPALQHIRLSIACYRDLYSTNYDLLLYWAIMAEPRTRSIVDLFWSGDDKDMFDAANTEVWASAAVRVFYLHGGLHLYRHAAGGTAKNIAHGGHNLLDLFGQLLEQGRTPLLVSEGTSADKLLTIRSSDYLTYCFDHFSAHEGRLVIFGHSLGEGDAHLVSAMRRWGRRRIGISVRQADESTLNDVTAYYRSRLPDADLVFFDAATHPLGDPILDMSRPALVRTAAG